ncbi:hypothetical protein SGRA_0907 [Saprospira grandis str. Lewin]|uniref:Uncharacterized protein n=1 Tax=Saprospira grandis (strain Lewin) TaxID=984262 RepID=H6L2I5_SAPGL|nr:hypothetical protein SGRA_0907 [Saprospira grandis str. Lewin]
MGFLDLIYTLKNPYFGLVQPLGFAACYSSPRALALGLAKGQIGLGA